MPTRCPCNEAFFNSIHMSRTKSFVTVERRRKQSRSDNTVPAIIPQILPSIASREQMSPASTSAQVDRPTTLPKPISTPAHTPCKAYTTDQHRSRPSFPLFRIRRPATFHCGASRLLQLLLRSELRRVTTLPLSAVGSSGRKSGVADSADLLVTLHSKGTFHQSLKLHLRKRQTHVVLVGQNLQGRLDDTTSQSQDQVQSRLLLNVVVGQSSAIFELLAGEDQSLLVRGDTFLVLNLSRMKRMQG